MNERQAIEFEMQLLKEESRRDFEMYFELRKQSRERYTQLQNRLRQIDERDMYKPPAPIEEPARLVPKSADMSIEQLRVDKYKEPAKKANRGGKAPLVPNDKLIPFIEDFLKVLNNPVHLKLIRSAAEREFNVTWANFNTVMRNAVKGSKHIAIDKEQKNWFYSYKE
jgi:hypothetical protein